jgi:hypothetical protein
MLDQRNLIQRLEHPIFVDRFNDFGHSSSLALMLPAWYHGVNPTGFLKAIAEQGDSQTGAVFKSWLRAGLSPNATTSRRGGSRFRLPGILASPRMPRPGVVEVHASG